MNKFIYVFALLAWPTLAWSGCKPATDKNSIDFKKKAERIFLIYTDRKIHTYKVNDPMLCDEKIVVFVEGEGSDRKIGGYWSITYDKSNFEMTINPGK